MANYDKAKTCLELCRFSYKMYAQTLAFPFDPFFEAGIAEKSGGSDDGRIKLMTYLHSKRQEEIMNNPLNPFIGFVKEKVKDVVSELDPIEYILDRAPDPKKSAIYRADTDNSYILFNPDTWDKAISNYAGFDTAGRFLDHANSVNMGTVVCGYFQGLTGMTKNHPVRGWRSFLGAVIYDSKTQTAYIVFRGSRSGKGSRAATQAQFFSKGNPDWVTDMNHLKESWVFDSGMSGRFQMAGGFWKAFASSSTSMEAAFKYATTGKQVKNVCVTGHSLGGALAQCAYIYFCDNSIREKLQLNNALIECYPISAPPVCLGLETQHWISRNADATNVHHYYCPYDAVHACRLIKGGLETKLAGVLSIAHPLQSAYHFGSQIALNCDTKFPDAHEPMVIWDALWKNESTGTSNAPRGFWKTFKLTTNNCGINPVGVSIPSDQATRSEVKLALGDCFNNQMFFDRALNWTNSMENRTKGDQARNKINEIISLSSQDNHNKKAITQAIKDFTITVKIDSNGAKAARYTLDIWDSFRLILESSY